MPDALPTVSYPGCHELLIIEMNIDEESRKLNTSIYKYPSFDEKDKMVQMNGIKKLTITNTIINVVLFEKMAAMNT